MAVPLTFQSGIDSVQRTHELLATGLLSGWGGVGLLLLAGGWVCFQLKRELWHRGREEKTVRILFALRVAIVLAAVWLLCQPMLVTRTVWREKPRVLLLESRGVTMKTREEFGALHRKIDALISLGQLELEDRNAAASRIAHALELQVKVLEGALERFSKDLSNLTSGLPPAPGFQTAVDKFVGDLKVAGGPIAAARNLLPEGSADLAFQAELSEFLKRLSLNKAAAEMLSAEVMVAVKEAYQHPDLLERFVEDLKKTLTESKALMSEAGDIQAGLDKQFVGAAVLAEVEKKSWKRQELADQTAQWIQEKLGKRADVHRQSFDDLTEGLQSAAAEQLKGRLTSIFVLDDGTRENSDSTREILTTLSQGQVSIHSVLIGEDKVEPVDVGLVAVELPLNVETGVRFKGRALVKVRTPEAAKSKLIIKSVDTVLAELDVPAGDLRSVEFDAVLNEKGRHKLVVQVVTDARDGFEGNEEIERVVHAHEKRPVVMMVADGLSRDFVMIRQIAQSIPHIETESVLAVPEMGEIKLGEKKGQFPKTAKQWERIRLLVVVGNVPTGLDQVAKDAFKDAVNSGLNVLLIETQGKDLNGRWTEIFGMKRSAGMSRLLPVEGKWLPFYSLSVDWRASMAAWQSLPELAESFSIEGGIRLLNGETENAPLKLLPVGRGGVVYCGVRSLTKLRQGGTAKVVNRLVRGVIEFAAMPWDLEGSGATSPNGLDRLPGLVSDGIRNVSDFRLAANAAPLKEVAKMGNGSFTGIVGLPDLLEEMDLNSVEKSKVETWALWEGWWPLVLILLFASVEYLLRRKAGRVM